MQIIDVNKGKEIELEKLKSGDTFKIGDLVYMVISHQPVRYSCGEIHVIRLLDGEFCTIHESTEVVKVRGCFSFKELTEKDLMELENSSYIKQKHL